MSDGGPAFPEALNTGASIELQRGMTLRDYFAAAQLNGVMTSATGLGALSDEERARQFAGVAKIVYELADAMLKERDK
jgi:hypothetical protein